jgi:hypothetical protein
MPGERDGYISMTLRFDSIYFLTNNRIGGRPGGRWRQVRYLTMWPALSSITVASLGNFVYNNC